MKISKIKIWFSVAVLSFAVLSCSKKKNDQSQQIEDFIERTTNSKFANATLTLSDARKIGENEVYLKFNSTLNRDQLEPSFVSAAVRDLIINMVKKDPKNLELLQKGVKFRTEVIDAKNQKIFSEIIDKSSMTKNPVAVNYNSKIGQLNQMLEIANANLPQVDSTTGIVLQKIYLGNNRDVIYATEVPGSISSIISSKENHDIIKKNMAKDSALKKMLKNLGDFDITALKYKYQGKSGKLLQEVKMENKDFE